jgi:hypothetical protein
VSDTTNARDEVGFGVFVPVLLILFALIVQAAADHVELRTTRGQLDAQYTKQTQPLDEAQKLRSQLQAIAGDTALLAEQGNPNAIKLRDLLAQQGVNIKPPSREEKAAATPPP